MVSPHGAVDANRTSVVEDGEVVVIILGCFLVASAPQAEVAQEDTHWDEELGGWETVHVTPLGCLGIDVWCEVGDEIVGNLLDVVLRVEVHVAFFLSEDWLCDEWHAAVVDGKLEVGPCTECLHCCIFACKDFLASLGEHGINSREEEVAVLNHCIVV